MLLRDCPVGSVVRLVSLEGEPVVLSNWEGDFIVYQKGEIKYVIDGNGLDRTDVDSNPDYQFGIVTLLSSKHKTVYLKGKTYNLIPVRTSDVIEIDGVEYYMEEKK